jgi:hypothetical protein
LEIQLLSRKERKAKRVIFDPRRTLILGKNHTGKSSLMKSIYYTLGAEVTFHPKFRNAAVVSKVRIKVNTDVYDVVRDGKNFGVFDTQGNLLHKFTSVTKGLGLFLSSLLDFKPLLQSKSGDFIIPPPAYLFLPYYVDQDESWSKSWLSFLNLQQIKDHRNQMILYHSGIRPNEYYSTKKEVDELLHTIEEINKEKKVTNQILNELQDKISQTGFNVNVDAFKNEIRDLLIECESLKKKEELLKEKLLDYYNIKATIESQVAIVKNSILENHKDLAFASINLPQVVDCPTCGAHYENSFTERFEIANDEQRGTDLLLELLKELNGVEEKISRENNDLTRTISEVEHINAILEHKQGEIQFKDVIDNYGKNQVHELFRERVSLLNEAIQANAIDLENQKARLKRLENTERKAEITSFFINRMGTFLRALDIHSLTESDYSTITAKFESKETGSSRPRALIAYYYAFLYIIKKYSTTTFCPIIIDSPNQQDQDIEHIDKIMEFINKNQPEDTQLILGLAETYGVDFECLIIELKEKYSLLQTEEYEAVNADLGELVNKMWFN